jgi:hypothetical protein
MPPGTGWRTAGRPGDLTALVANVRGGLPPKLHDVLIQKTLPLQTSCKGCLKDAVSHDWDCRYVGRGRHYVLAADYVTIILCEIDPANTLLPSALAREHVVAGGRSLTKSSKSDAALNALRNAKDLALTVKEYVGNLPFRATPFDWPMWWMENVVLEYSRRPDEVQIADALSEPGIVYFRYVTLTRTQALQRVKSSGLRFMHVGCFLPTATECTEHSLPPVVEFVWPLPVRHLIRRGSMPAVICTSDGCLWVADTGCGYHLVAEADVTRGTSIVVKNPGARKLHTANGEIQADECVKVCLPELGLTNRLATILQSTPRVLSVGALCLDDGCTFYWPAGGTPFFTLKCGTIIYCEVYGKVPYLRTGSMALATLPKWHIDNEVLALPGTSSPSTPPEGNPGEGVPLPPLPRPNAFQRMEQALMEDGAEHPEDAIEKPTPKGDEFVAEDALEEPDTSHVDGRNVRVQKAEATTLRHLMTHHPKNQYCNICCRAKVQNTPHRRKSARKYWQGKLEPAKFGDQVTADHLVAHSDRSRGVTMDTAALVVGDRFTGWFEGIPLKTKGVDSTLWGLRKFSGSEKIVRAWSDNSEELLGAFTTLGTLHDLALQGRPQSNGRAERLVRSCMDGTKTLLLQAGLPPGFWPYAMKAYSFAQNIDVIDGDSAWNRRHNQGQFKGRTIPFGCLVHFKPQPDKKKKMPKGSPDSVAGVFFGYKVQPGGLWDHEYKVVDLRSFKDMDFSGWGYPANVNQQTVREVVWDKSAPVIFPLYAKYARANDTIEGIEGRPDDEPEQGELFAEVQGPLDAPEAGGATVKVEPPVNAPAQPHDHAPIGRVPRGVEITRDGKTYRQDASGREYELDISGSRIYAGSGRPPWVPDYEWKVFSLKNKKELTRQWKASIADDVAKARAKAAQELLTPHAPSSSSSGTTVAVATPARSRLDVPLLCVDELTTARAAHAIEIWYATTCTVATGCGRDEDEVPEDPGFVPPAMPVLVRPIGYKPRHRQKIPEHSLPFAACVARPVSKSEVATNPAAQKAMDVEFEKLRTKTHPKLKVPGCWDEKLVEEMSSVKSRARKQSKMMHFGKVFGICVEKGSELKVGDVHRKFKGRYVFQGNDVRDQNWEAAIFQELGSSPAAMEAGNSCEI